MSIARSLRWPWGPTAVVVGALVCACGDEEPVVVVHLQARPAVTGVVELAVELANASSTQTQTFAVAGRDFPLSFSVQTPGRTGDLTVDVVAKDGGGLARGVGRAVIPIGTGRVDADLLLEPNDFVVNTTYVGSQDLAFRLDGGGRQLAVSDDGVFTIGWSDTCQMVGRCDVFGRRFDATGTAVATAIAAGGGQFNWNQSDGETGYEPSLVTDRLGHTLAVWTTIGTTFAVVIDQAGNYVTPIETIITSMTSPGTPAVTVLPDGRYVVAWTDTAPTAGQTVVKARYLSAAGQPAPNPITNTTDPFVVSTTVRTTDEAPAVVALGNGAALAFAWRSDSRIYGRLYGSTGQAVGPDVVAADHPGDEVGPPQLATLGGDVVMLYRHQTLPGGAAEHGELMLRRYTATGAGVGAAVTVTSDSELGPPALAIRATDVAVAWSGCNEDSDGAGCGIRVRRYDGDLAPVGASQIVNSTTAGDQEDPSLGWLPDRSLAVTWSDGSATDPDRDMSAVRARIFYPAAP